MNYPGGVGSDAIDLEMRPDEEHPLAEPSFGFTEDGKRRFFPFER